MDLKIIIKIFLILLLLSIGNCGGSFNPDDESCYNEDNPTSFKKKNQEVCNNSESAIIDGIKDDVEAIIDDPIGVIEATGVSDKIVVIGESLELGFEISVTALKVALEDVDGFFEAVGDEASEFWDHPWEYLKEKGVELLKYLGIADWFGLDCPTIEDDSNSVSPLIDTNSIHDASDGFAGAFLVVNLPENLGYSIVNSEFAKTGGYSNYNSYLPFDEFIAPPSFARHGAIFTQLALMIEASVGNSDIFMTNMIWQGYARDDDDSYTIESDRYLKSLMKAIKSKRENIFMTISGHHTKGDEGTTSRNEYEKLSMFWEYYLHLIKKGDNSEFDYLSIKEKDVPWYLIKRGNGNDKEPTFHTKFVLFEKTIINDQIYTYVSCVTSSNFTLTGVNDKIQDMVCVYNDFTTYKRIRSTIWKDKDGNEQVPKNYFSLNTSTKFKNYNGEEINIHKIDKLSDKDENCYLEEGESLSSLKDREICNNAASQVCRDIKDSDGYFYITGEIVHTQNDPNNLEVSCHGSKYIPKTTSSHRIYFNKTDENLKFKENGYVDDEADVLNIDTVITSHHPTFKLLMSKTSTGEISPQPFGNDMFITDYKYRENGTGYNIWGERDNLPKIDYNYLHEANINKDSYGIVAYSQIGNNEKFSPIDYLFGDDEKYEESDMDFVDYFNDFKCSNFGNDSKIYVYADGYNISDVSFPNIKEIDIQVYLGPRLHTKIMFTSAKRGKSNKNYVLMGSRNGKNNNTGDMNFLIKDKGKTNGIYQQYKEFFKYWKKHTVKLNDAEIYSRQPWPFE